MIIFPKTPEENAVLKAWLEERIPGVNMGDCYCLGVMRDDKIAAVAGFNNYRTVDIEMSFASDNPRWATKETITWILGYPFLQLGCQRVTAMVKKSNMRCRKLLLGVGFREEGKHRHAAENKESMFSYGLVKDDYIERYLNGKEITASSAAAA